MPPHRLILTPVDTKPGSFTASLEGSPTATFAASRQPVVDGARVLLGLGYDPSDILVARQHDRPYDSLLPATIGHLAKVTYSEPDRGRLHAVTWMPFAGLRVGQKSTSEGVGGTDVALGA